jgi:hypothetical protein
MEALDRIKSQVPVKIMRKINLKELAVGETIIVQSLEGIPKLKQNVEIQPRLLYFRHD